MGVEKPDKTCYIALLRGINVGGKNIIKMERLRQVFEDMGFFDVKTYIQSGNIIFWIPEAARPAPGARTELTARIENQLKESFSADIKTLVLTVGDLAEAVENAPEGFGSEPEKYRYDVWFLLPPATVSDVLPGFHLREGVDALWAGKNVLYTSRLTSQMGKSYFSKIVQTQVYNSFTIRNWNTTIKLLELCVGLAPQFEHDHDA